MPDMCQEGWHGASNRGGRVRDGGGTFTSACCWPPPPVSAQGGAQWGELPVQPRLPIGYGAAVPATRPPAGAATRVVMANGSEFWAQLRSAEACQPHQKPDTPAPAPDPSPPARPPNRAAKSPQPLLAQAARPSPPSPRLPGPVPPLAQPAGGPGPCTRPLPPSEGSSGVGGGGKEGGGEGGASPFSERAQSWSQKSRRRDIQTEPRCVWQEEREGERERRRGRERRKERGQGKSGRGLQSPNHALRAWRVSRAVGWGPGPTCPGGSGLRPMETAGHPSWPGQDDTAEAKINVRWVTERVCGAAQTYTRTHHTMASVHAGPGARVGPTAGPPRPPDLRGASPERPAHSSS